MQPASLRLESTPWLFAHDNLNNETSTSHSVPEVSAHRLVSPSGVSGPGPAAPLPVALSSGLRGSAGLPASAVCHRVGRAEADGPGRRQRGRNALPERCRLLPDVPAQELHAGVLGPGRVRGLEREDEHVQRLQVIGGALPTAGNVWLDGGGVMINRRS